MLDAITASGAEVVTVSIRRISLEGYAESMVDLLGSDYVLLPNTAGCSTAREAVLTAKLAREALLQPTGSSWKSSATGETLHPDVIELLAPPRNWWPMASRSCPTATTIPCPAGSWPMPEPPP